MTRIDPGLRLPGAPPRPAQAQRPELVLDLSRLVSRMLHPTPTGVDRVELAYARGLLAQAGDRLHFAAVHPCGFYGRIGDAAAQAFLDHTERRWLVHGVYETRAERYREAMRWLWRLRPGPAPRPSGPRVLIQPSPNHLDRPDRIAAKLAREQAHLICLVHDLIPITHPEFARPGGAARHRRRLQTIESHASGILVNSQATMDALHRQGGFALADKPIRLAPLGIDAGTPLTTAPSGRSYFVIVGTIEPRKNHLLLLSVWRDLCERLGSARAPQLFIVGRRGWENENVIDMLERCEALSGVVRELDRLPDVDLRALLAGASALLMPSFAEGFGLPVAEALAAGVPVIASDLPAHREAGGGVPEYLDPLDGPAWREAILAYAGNASPRRGAQIKRMIGWSPRTWDDHLETVLALADEVAQC